jgi:plastocyanin
MRAVIILGLLALPALLVAGCGDEEEGAGGSSGKVPVTLSDFKIQPDNLEAEKPETVTYVVTNKGNTEHALEIEGNGIEEETDTLQAGDVGELTVTLKPGTYEMYCPIDDHRAQGMEGTLTVAGSSAGGGGTTTDEDETETDDDGGYGYG